MLSGAVAGILRVGAVVLTGGALGGGVYFLVQVGEEEDASRLQVPEATATLSAPGPLSPPDGVTTPPTATPTFPPAPITPPALDTSDWKTYTSPLGFTIKYPPGWLAEGRDIPDLAPGRARIINERAQEVRALRDPDDPGEGFKGGEALIDIYPIPYPPRFDADELLTLCGTDDESAQQSGLSGQASAVTFAGLPAVLCQQEGPSPFDDHWFTQEIYWVELPSGGVLHIGSIAADADDTTRGLLRVILSTISFEDSP